LSDSQVILIVEDAVELAQIALHRMGLETHHAPNGQRALDFLASNRPDLMLLDIGLPGMSGWDILEALKTNENADFPIIILTASGDPVNRLIGRLQERVIRYMVKPFSVDDLSRAVREALGTAS
jgi:two-component system catabolic regulation response regulator CreB